MQTGFGAQQARITVGTGDFYGDVKLTTDLHVGLKVRTN
jgi:hypothetical protein